ncbi:hypothetical protein V5O48_003343 [Marasmius crinis-equi]|uniref:Uncharacterized protein n=1 Tax=Marasmius crinis-equi TaxID=585013 RepID=A0ABR3FT46_9AGAR
MKSSILGVSCLTLILLSLVLQRALKITYSAYSPPLESGGSSPLSFSPKFSAPVAMHYEATTVRYALDGPESDEEFAKLIPPTGHTIHIPSSSTHSNEPVTHTVTLFHQLKCLDIIRREYGDAYPSTPELTQHCLTYLHQTIMCRPFIALEVTKNVFATGKKSREVVCRDWEAVYREAERNWQVYRTLT